MSSTGDLDFLNALVDLAVSQIQPSEIWLFGSRARGDWKPTSDVDLFFETHCRNDQWANFVSDCDDLNTLLPLDLVSIQRADQAFIQHVKSEGKCIYGRPKKIAGQSSSSPG